jgi:hypothetical protein
MRYRHQAAHTPIPGILPANAFVPTAPLRRHIHWNAAIRYRATLSPYICPCQILIG